MNTISLTCFNMEGEVRGKNFVTMKIVDYIKRLKRWEHFDAHSTNALKDELITLDGAYFPKLRLGNMHSERELDVRRGFNHRNESAPFRSSDRHVLRL
jgi:hypothetical protein